MITNLDDVVLGAKYKDVVTGFVGICTTKTICLTGCDRVGLESSADKGETKVLGCDITCLEYIDKGVSERFEKKPAAAVAGAPSVRSSR